MYLPSLYRITTGLLNTVARFPFETITTMVGACACYLMVTGHSDHRLIYTKLTLTATLGLVLYLSSGLFARSMGKGKAVYLLFQCIITGLLAAYYFSLPDFIQETHMQKHVILLGVGHLGVAFAPFLYQRHVDAFWHYNKRIFIRILTSGLYSVVLYGGLGGVLGALDALFGIQIVGDTYVLLACIIFGIFNTLFFLSGIPAQPEKAHEGSSYPAGLSMFTQYVLIPLVTIYMVILFAYEAKIGITLNLPKGWISALIIAFSVVGILANLLVYPLRDNSDKAWIRFFARWFYLLMLPLLLLFYWAIAYRISQYGITEERYYLLIVAIWLTGISLYFIFSRNKNILFIPTTLAGIGLFSLFAGPLSAGSVSLRSQLSRLEQLLNSPHIASESKLQQDAIDVIQYAMQTHGRMSVAPIFGDSLLQRIHKRSESEEADRFVNPSECIALLESKGINYTSADDKDIREMNEVLDVMHTEYVLQNENLIDVAGYRYSVHINAEEANQYTLPDGSTWMIDAEHIPALRLTVNGKQIWNADIKQHVKRIAAVAQNEKENRHTQNDDEIGYTAIVHELSQAQLAFPIRVGNEEKATWVYRQLTWDDYPKDSAVRIQNWSATLLIK